MKHQRMLFLAAAFLAIASSTARGQAASSVCKDGTTSAASGKGACSGHGGVDTKATEAAKKKAAAPAKKAAAEPKKSAPEKAAPAKTAAKAPAEAKKTATKSDDNSDPKDATAKCKDGTYSHAANHQGACSRHGGVDKFLKP